MLKSILFAALLIVCPLVLAEQVAPQPNGDNRLLVEMPIEAQQFIRKKMVENLTAVNSILIALDNKDWSSIETITSSTLAMRAGMQATPQARPGQYMPLDMRKIGQSLHQASDELIIAAQQKDEVNARDAMQRIVNSCVACHSVYRIR